MHQKYFLPRPEACPEVWLCKISGGRTKKKKKVGKPIGDPVGGRDALTFYSTPQLSIKLPAHGNGEQ